MEVCMHMSAHALYENTLSEVIATYQNTSAVDNIIGLANNIL